MPAKGMIVGHQPHLDAYYARGPHTHTPESWMSKLGDWFVPIPEAGCWIWMRALTGNGYGLSQSGGRLQVAHRVSYETLVGMVPNGLELDHLCRVRCCVNPDHLEPVTQLENLRRAAAARWTGFCPRGHALFGDNISMDREVIRCRTCHNAKEVARYRARKARRSDD